MYSELAHHSDCDRKEILIHSSHRSQFQISGIYELVVLTLIPSTNMEEELELPNLPSKGFSCDSQCVKYQHFRERNNMAES